MREIQVSLTEYEARALSGIANLLYESLDDATLEQIQPPPEGHVVSPAISGAMKLELAMAVAGISV